MIDWKQWQVSVVNNSSVAAQLSSQRRESIVHNRHICKVLT